MTDGRKSKMGNRKTKIGLLMLAMALSPLSSGPLLADQNDRAHQIGNKLKCMCNGCDQSAGKCYHVGGSFSGPCDKAKAMLSEIDGHIAQGKSDEQIMQAMIRSTGRWRIWSLRKRDLGWWRG